MQITGHAARRAWYRFAQFPVKRLAGRACAVDANAAAAAAGIAAGCAVERGTLGGYWMSVSEAGILKDAVSDMIVLLK